MRIDVDLAVELAPDSVTSHVYDDGSAYLELGTRWTIGQSLIIWAGREGADLAGEALVLRKLAEAASALADHLEHRAGPPEVTS